MGMPDWMSLLLSRPGQTVESQLDQAQAMRTREMALPPDMRMTGPRRELRDAFLARKLLNPMLNPVYPNDPWRTFVAASERDTALCRVRERIAELSAWMAEEDVARCEEVARTMHSWTLAQNRNGR